MTSGIYQIRCTITGKIYLGSSKNIEHRWHQHRQLRSSEHCARISAAKKGKSKTPESIAKQLATKRARGLIK